MKVTKEDVAAQGFVLCRSIDKLVPARNSDYHPLLLELYDMAQAYRNAMECWEIEDRN